MSETPENKLFSKLHRNTVVTFAEHKLLVLLGHLKL